MESFLGIDASKGYADFVLIDSTLNRLEDTFQLDDTAKGHALLEAHLTAFIQTHGLSKVFCGIESTGGFEDNWFAFLCRLSDTLPVEVARLNPCNVKKSADATKNHQTTDALSAFNIAAYLARYPDHVDYTVLDNKYREYRSLNNYITSLSKEKTKTVNRLKQLLYSCFPEILCYLNNGFPNWILELLVQYPTPQKLARAKAEKVARINNITKDKAIALIKKAKESISTRCKATDASLILTMAGDVLDKEVRLSKMKTLLAKQCTGPEIDLLLSIKGVAEYSAAAIMVEIEDINRFPSSSQLIGYFGLYPTLKMSGDKKYESRLSKKGRPAIRAVLYMCAKTAAIHDPHLKDIYIKQRAKGMKYNQAIGVLMQKMLRIIWGMLKNGEKYDCKVDAENQFKNLTGSKNNTEIEANKKRRLQQYDQSAPISNIAKRKRKAHLASQSGSSGKARDLEDVPNAVQT